ncbi:MAG: hypothetical protein JWR80_8649 [Bradyrhizobium sp.]|nr:hypothetical protein [Bradyrhizobium sp.]
MTHHPRDVGSCYLNAGVNQTRTADISVNPA